MKRVIITGATGTIGSALSDVLTNSDCEVFAICRPNSSNISNLKKRKNLHIVECDIGNLYLLKNEFVGEFDVFYHLAWSGTFGESRNVVDLQLANIKYTLDATKLAKELGCKIFIGTGSQAEYGQYKKPANENTITKPFTLYGASKLSAGQMSRVYANNIGVRHIWVRVFSVYGPCDDDRTLISYVIESLKNGEAPRLTKGEQFWDYLYSYDAADALIKIAKRGKNNSVYCLGSGEIRKLEDYILELGKIVNPNVKMVFGEVPYSKNQIKYLAADISLLSKDVGFKPQCSFKCGIKNMLNYLR